MWLNVPLRAVVGAPIAALALLASACGGGISEAEFVDELVDGGLDRATAQCIADGVQAAGFELADVTDEALGDEDPPAAVVDVTLDCVLAADDG